MRGWLQSWAIAIVVSIIPIGILASLAFQWIKRQSNWVDNLSPLLKNGAVFIITALVTTVSTVLGVKVVCEEGINCLTQLDEGTLKLLINAALALGVAKLTHRQIKKK